MVDETIRCALDALDAMADRWAEEVGLERMVQTILESPDATTPIRVSALIRQAFVEGAYRART